jgi:hypothetical protein
MVQQFHEMTDTTSDPATIQTRATAALQANKDVNAILSVGPHVCEAVDKALADLGMTVHHSCFDLSPAVMDLIGSGRVSFTIDQQQDYKVICQLSYYTCTTTVLDFYQELTSHQDLASLTSLTLLQLLL